MFLKGWFYYDLVLFEGNRNTIGETLLPLNRLCHFNQLIGQFSRKGCPMVSDIEQQGIGIHSYRRDDHRQTSQCFFIEASAVLFRPLFEGGVNRRGNIF